MMSDSERDGPAPRASRVSKGSTDEEIDSDIASLSSMDLPRKNDASSTAEHLSADDELDPDEGEGILLSDILSAAPNAEKKSVSEMVKKLIAPAYEDDDSDELPEEILDADDEDSEADEQKLADVAFAATNRRDLDKRRLREARIVAPVVGKEALHSAPGTEAVSQKEMMQRMLSTLGKASDGDKGLAIAQLEKKVARLHSDGKKELSVPLPAPVQGRIARAAAYGKVKETVTEKWEHVVRDNRKAEQLVFPLNSAGTRVGRNSSDIAGHFQPINEYEEEIQRLLVDAGVASEKQVVRGEEKAIESLGVSEVSKEEVMERRRQMAKMRSLMFHYERKMKRIKKIKSKKYRRMMKKEREKVSEMVGSEDEQEALMKAERRRAEERMTLRHKNTSKWVRRKLSRVETKREGDTKAAIEEQLRLHQELMKKQGVAVDSDDSDAEDSGENESETEEALEAKLKEIETDLVEGNAKTKKAKGLMGMHFMQAAQERQRKEALELLKEMKESNDSEDDGEELVRFKGKRYFNLEGQSREEAGASEPEEREALGLVEGDDGDVERLPERIQEAFVDSAKRKAVMEKRSKKEKDEKRTLHEQMKEDEMKEVEMKAVRVANRSDKGVDTESNPWVKARVQKKAIQKGKAADEGMKSEVEGGDVRDLLGNAGEEEKNKKKGKSNSDKVKRNAVRVVAGTGTESGRRSGEEGNGLGAGGNGTKAKRRSVERKGVLGVKGTEGDVDGESNPWLTGGKPKKAKRKSRKVGEKSEVKRARLEKTEDTVSRMRQVAAAFAGAGGAEEEDFEKAKMEDVERGAPGAKEVEAEVLPGWGKWDGAGVKESKNESTFARAARQRLAEARRSAIGGRKDGRLKHVILEEKRVKQAAQLTMAHVPFPFAKREEWEMEVRTPLCRELMTATSFSRVVRPRVSKRIGAVIEPIGETIGGKRAVVQLRKDRAERRARARKGLMR
eukprot:gb/GEZJ01002707.1/.p1 GENE.gb/GEZJ01002707.1/~~gb/GEZJ01002707.1/.p1  ORF type:complete len:959 (+),score=250.51 gb/GEZJ01002707.1/:250-3126(+)